MNIIYLNLYYICYNIQKKFLIFGIKTIIINYFYTFFNDEINIQIQNIIII